jgi:acetolactate synthase-1/2/3 large subunit
MTCQELGTISQEKLPVKIMILNNNFLGMVRQWQELFFDKRYSFVEMHNPDFVKLGEAFSIPGEVISKREDLNGALTRMLNHPAAYLLDIRVGKETNIFPMVPSGAAVDEVRLE